MERLHVYAATFVIALFLTTYVNLVYFSEDAQATGGAGQIAELVLVHLNDAALYLQEGDIASAEEELDKAIKELNDIYEADKEEH